MTYDYMVTYEKQGLEGSTITHGLTLDSRLTFPLSSDQITRVKAVIEAKNKDTRISRIVSLTLQEWVSSECPPRPEERNQEFFVDKGEGHEFRMDIARYDGQCWRGMAGTQIFPERWLFKTIAIKGD
jgi:hypothetical protein